MPRTAGRVSARRRCAGCFGADGWDAHVLVGGHREVGHVALVEGPDQRGKAGNDEFANRCLSDPEFKSVIFAGFARELFSAIHS